MRACEEMSASVLLERGQIRAAYDASLQVVGELTTGVHPFRTALDAARAWHLHGLVCWHNARMTEAERALGMAYAARLAANGEDHDETLDSLERLAAVAHYQLRHDLAIERFEKAIAGRVRLHGEDHVRVAIARRNFAAHQRDQRRLTEA